MQPNTNNRHRDQQAYTPSSIPLRGAAGEVTIPNNAIAKKCHCAERSDKAISTPTILSSPFTLAIVTILLITACLIPNATAEDKPQPKPKITVDYVQLINELTKPKNYDPAQNAMPLYEKASELLTKKPESLTTSMLVNYSGLSEKEFAVVNDWVKENQQALNLARQADKKKYCWAPYSSSSEGYIEMNTTELSNIRKLFLLGLADACVRARSGNTRRAYELLMNEYRKALHVNSGGMLIDRLVSIAIVSASSGTCMAILSQEQHSLLQIKRFRRLLGNTITLDDMQISYSEAEKQLSLDFIQRIFSDDGNGNGRLLPDAWLEEREKGLFSDLTAEQAERIAASHPDRKTTCNLLDEKIKQLNELALVPPCKLNEQNTDYRQTAEALVSDLPALEDDLATGGAILGSAFRAKAYLEALDCVLAIMEYKAVKHRYPTTLDDLSYYLDQLPLDPYSGKPLVYKRTPDGFTLYSIGADFNDDNGNHDPGWGRKDGDYVFWPPQQPQTNQEQTP